MANTGTEPQLNRQTLPQAARAGMPAAAADPIRILQIGEGNFLRGFADWMIQQSRDRGLFRGSVAVVQPRKTGKAKIEALAGQDGLYTLVIRGLENGRAAERKEVVDVFAKAFDPYGDWSAFLALAALPELRFVISNTTEAGLAYKPQPLTPGEPVESFPGKLTALLYERYRAWEGAPDKGLILLPTELLERNGDTLRDCVLRHAEDWRLPADFVGWVTANCRFLNSLVDRIVTGYPEERQAEAWFREWGYRDTQLTTAEPYHLWAIQGEAGLDKELPLAAAGLNVHWVDDLTPFQQRKVRILNGAHTLMTPLALLRGLEQVREVMEHPELGPFVEATIREDIVPLLPYEASVMNDYADAVFERFRNPFIRHRLADIAMNSLSKFKVRLLSSLLAAYERGGGQAERLTLGFAALLRYCKVRAAGDGFAGTTPAGAAYAVRDDAESLKLLAAHWERAASAGLAAAVGGMLAEERLWGADLSGVAGLADAVAAQLERLERIEQPERDADE